MRYLDSAFTHKDTLKWDSQFGWEEITKSTFDDVRHMAGVPSLPDLFIRIRADLQNCVTTIRI